MFQNNEGALVPPKMHLWLVPSGEGQGEQCAGGKREMLNLGTGTLSVSKGAIAVSLAEPCLEPTLAKVKVHLDPD